MSVFKRNGNWWISYFDPPGGGGKRIKEKVGPSKQDAETLLGVRRKAINEGIHPELRRVRPVLFKAHAAEVLEKHYKPKRCHGWAKLVIEVHLIPFFGERTLAQITPHLISDYMTQRLAVPVSRGTVNGERAVLSKVMSLARKWKRVHENPVGDVEKYEKPEGRQRVLSHDEADRLIAHAARHLKPIIMTALETGGRKTEILGLKWDAVDFDRGVLYYVGQTTKNAKVREIPMTPLLTSTLRELFKVRSIKEGARAWVFTRYGKRLRDVRTAWACARKAAGLGEDVLLHTCRHTFCTWYASQPGANPFVLKELAGHADMKTTMGYFHGSSEIRRMAIPLMGRQANFPGCPPNVPAGEVERKEQVQVV